MSISRFQVLFYLSNQDISVVEIKRLDLPETVEKSDRFHWLLVDKNYLVQKLTFVSMSQENGFQVREFKEGKLRFNKDLGFYGTEASCPLKCHQPDDLPDTLASLLDDYLT
ncbi:hypothetical protein [Kiloniella majae]|uniref:hypothetical protein n=1 Tax=Kiloniella majae TaxID=1938558 RepID=UPI000A279677|nr:hypothetical protein [Kiloniella majae]